MWVFYCGVENIPREVGVVTLIEMGPPSQATTSNKYSRSGDFWLCPPVSPHSSPRSILGHPDAHNQSIFLWQQNRRHRPVPFRDHPNLAAILQPIGRQHPTLAILITLMGDSFIIEPPVFVIQLAPIPLLMPQEKSAG